MIFFHPLIRLSTWLAKRRRDRVVAGLLTSVYWQVTTGLLDVQVERHGHETDEEHASRELVAGNEHARSSLVAIGLMVRNELSARGILGTVEADALHAAPPMVLRKNGPLSTPRRTVTEKPE